MTTAPETLEHSHSFARRTLAFVLGISIAGMIGALVVGIVTGGGQAPAPGSTTYSTSATGHDAFKRLLAELDVPVFVSTHATARKARDTGVMVLLEPDVNGGAADEQAVESMLEASSLSLIVLPKWDVTAAEGSDEISKAFLKHLEEPQAVARLIDVKADVVRPSPIKPVDWSSNALGFEPTLDSPQLITSATITPLVACDEGILIGEIHEGTRHRVVISDPDVLSNHGLIKGDNAAMVIAALDRVRPRDAPVIIDETMHGIGREPSLWHELFTPPLAFVAFQVLLTLALLLWAGTGRFGAPAPAPRRVQPGKKALIDNTADLLRYGGHGTHALVRYLDLTVAEAAKRLHAKPGMSPEQSREWLSRLGAARGAGIDLRALEAEVFKLHGDGSRDSRAIVHLAAQLARWSQEIVHGTGVGTGSR